MLSIDMSKLWDEDEEMAVQGITEATNNIIAYHNNPNASENMLSELCDDIWSICNFWTGHTHVGNPKTDIIKNAFQSFFDRFFGIG